MATGVPRARQVARQGASGGGIKGDSEANGLENRHLDLCDCRAKVVLKTQREEHTIQLLKY